MPDTHVSAMIIFAPPSSRYFNLPQITTGPAPRGEGRTGWHRTEMRDQLTPTGCPAASPADRTGAVAAGAAAAGAAAAGAAAAADRWPGRTPRWPLAAPA